MKLHKLWSNFRYLSSSMIDFMKIVLLNRINAYYNLEPLTG